MAAETMPIDDGDVRGEKSSSLLDEHNTCSHRNGLQSPLVEPLSPLAAYPANFAL